MAKRPALQPYGKPHNDSGIAAYATGPGWIALEFKHGGCYRYDANAPGARHVAEMTRLARAGDGLNTYLNQHVREHYAERLW
ncbi:MAG TPA: hypothetical protein VLA61_05455 [Ideonella sp.]|uniref:hypothetical protein n=1 Tax=Ideonella sp. TaxID=1929293 RepID=UPI002D093D88|nr:hypothetical protein [Ideonella sp.]HSI47691.1 hypothetical protein [Ideonella sp.]